MLHWHSLFWGGLPHWLTQRCAGHDELAKHVSGLLTTAYTAHVTPELHAARLIRRMEGVTNIRPAYYAPTPPDVAAPAIAVPLVIPSGATPEDITKLVAARNILAAGDATLANVNVHTHCPTCHKGFIGQCDCRLAYPRGTGTNTTPILVDHVSVPTGKDNHVKLAPRGMPAGDPPHLVVPPQSTTLHAILQHTAAPGGDYRLLEYPLYRPHISVDPSRVFDAADREGAERQLLKHQHDKLLNVFKKLSLRPRRCLSNADDLETARAIVREMMRDTCFGELGTDSNVVVEADATIEAIRAIPEPRRTQLLHYLSMQNGLLGESNRVGIAALGCNFNAQPLISTESAFRAIFYIIDYVTKDSLQPSDILSFIQAARTRCTRFGGKAPEGVDPAVGDRPAQRLLQCVQNGLANVVETAVQQCVLNVQGLPSHDCSDFFTFIFTSPAIREFRRTVARVHNEDEGDTVDASVRDGVPPRLHTVTVPPATVLPPPPAPVPAAPVDDAALPHDFDPYAANDGIDAQAPNLPGMGTLHRCKNNDLATTSQDLQYLHRGPALAFMSITEYGCCVNRVPLVNRASSAENDGADDGDDDEGVHSGNFEDGAVEDNHDAGAKRLSAPATTGVKRGRKRSGVYPFDDQYPLNEVFQQRLKSLLTIPIFGGFSSVPSWPTLTLETLSDDEFATQQAVFAEWVLAVLVPLPAPPYVNATTGVLCVPDYPDADQSAPVRLYKLLNELRTGSFLLNAEGTAYMGPPGYAVSISRDDNPDAFKAYHFSQGCLLRYIGSLARGMRRPSPAQRKVQATWRGRGAHSWSSLDFESLLFPEDFARNHAASGMHESDAEEGATSTEINLFIINTLRELHNADEADLNGEGKSNAERVFLDAIDSAHRVIRGNGAVSATAAAAFAEYPRMGTFAPMTEEVARIAHELNSKTKLPVVENTQLAAHRDGGAAAALAGMKALPSNSPNAGQCRVLEPLAAYFDALAAGETPRPPLMFVTGPGGTGKSFVFKCVETLAGAAGCSITPTAMTGVACTAIPTTTTAHTTASQFALGIAPTRIKPLSGTMLQEYKDALGNTALVIIDEISFATPSLLAAVDR